ncbi:VanZ family protein [Clostridia bacterium]|nr:VanZ family protein [Clostridia bacterium]
MSYIFMELSEVLAGRVVHVLLGLILIYMLSIGIRVVQKRHYGLPKESALFLLFFYCCLLIMLVSPTAFQGGWPSLDNWQVFFSPQYINLTPFQTIHRYTVGSDAFFINILGNILLFIPVGLYAATLLEKPRWWKVTAAIAFFSIAIELTQLLSFRVTDIDDVLLNTLGGWMGYITYLILRNRWKRIRID